MNWEALGSVAELIAAIGGVAAVVYLAIQIRLNTRAVRSSAIDSWVSAVALGNDAMAKTDAFAGVAITDPDALDEHQRRVFHRSVAQMCNALEALYFHHQNGVVDEPFLEAKIRPLVSFVRQPGPRRWWETRGKVILDPRFVSYVEEKL